jgi:hypothetical protein
VYDTIFKCFFLRNHLQTAANLSGQPPLAISGPRTTVRGTLF